jgi:hypothetical protein
MGCIPKLGPKSGTKSVLLIWNGIVPELGFGIWNCGAQFNVELKSPWSIKPKTLKVTSPLFVRVIERLVVLPLTESDAAVIERLWLKS